MVLMFILLYWNFKNLKRESNGFLGLLIYNRKFTHVINSVCIYAEILSNIIIYNGNCRQIFCLADTTRVPKNPEDMCVHMYEIMHYISNWGHIRCDSDFTTVSSLFVLHANSNIRRILPPPATEIKWK